MDDAWMRSYGESEEIRCRTRAKPDRVGGRWRAVEAMGSMRQQAVEWMLLNPGHRKRGGPIGRVDAPIDP